MRFRVERVSDGMVLGEDLELSAPAVSGGWETPNPDTGGAYPHPRDLHVGEDTFRSFHMLGCARGKAQTYRVVRQPDALPSDAELAGVLELLSLSVTELGGLRAAIARNREDAGRPRLRRSQARQP